MLDHGYPKDWSTLKKLIWQWQAAGGGSLPWAEFTGNPVMFDAPRAHNVNSAIVEFEPQQDLHGYANPWPAGGGKNTLDYDTVFANVKVGENDFEGALSDGFSGDKSLSQYIGKTITISCYLSSVSGYSNLYITTQVNGAYKNSNNVTEGNNGYISVTVTPETNADIWRFNYGSTTSNPKMLKAKDFQIEESPSRTPWTPYSNLCPISGYTGLSLYDDPAYGGLINWNQLIQDGDFGRTGNWLAQGCTLAMQDNTGTFTITNEDGYDAYIRQTNVATTEGHVYFLGFTFKINTAWQGNNGFKVILLGTETVTAYQSGSEGRNVYKTEELLYTATKSNTTIGFGKIALKNTLANGDTIDVKNIMLCDLTAMFGVGNEPATVDEFKELFPHSYYPYNAGEQTLVSKVNGDPYEEYEVTFGVCSANQWNEEWEEGRLSWTGENYPDNTKIRSKGFMPVAAGETYRIVTSNNLQIFYYDSNKEFVSFESSSKANQSTITIPAGCDYLRFYTYGSDYGNVYKHDIAINYPDTVTYYNPYSEECYGGSYNFVTGVLTATMAEVDLGTLTWTKNPDNNVFYAPFSGNTNRYNGNYGYNYVSSVFKYGANMNNMWLGTEDGLCVEPQAISSVSRIYARNEVYNSLTADQFKTAMNGVQVVYDLETPVTYQLDPQTITALKGPNVFFSDGKVITIEAKATEAA